MGLNSLRHFASYLVWGQSREWRDIFLRRFECLAGFVDWICFVYRAFAFVELLEFEWIFVPIFYWMWIFALLIGFEWTFCWEWIVVR